MSNSCNPAHHQMEVSPKPDPWHQLAAVVLQARNEDSQFPRLEILALSSSPSCPKIK